MGNTCLLLSVMSVTYVQFSCISSIDCGILLLFQSFFYFGCSVPVLLFNGVHVDSLTGRYMYVYVICESFKCYTCNLVI